MTDPPSEAGRRSVGGELWGKPRARYMTAYSFSRPKIVNHRNVLQRIVELWNPQRLGDRYHRRHAVSTSASPYRIYRRVVRADRDRVGAGRAHRASARRASV